MLALRVARSSCFVVLPLAILTLSACASPASDPFSDRPSDRVYSLSQVDARPVLLGCAGYTDPVSPSAVRAAVAVRFVVNRDGTVNPGSAVPVSSGGADSDALIDVAVSAARSCVYTPASRKGAPVAVRATKVFRFT